MDSSGVEFERFAEIGNRRGWNSGRFRAENRESGWMSFEMVSYATVAYLLVDILNSYLKRMKIFWIMYIHIIILC